VQIPLHLRQAPNASRARSEQALADLRERLGAQAVEQPDETGFFAADIEAESYDDAVMRVRDTIAAIGADECFELGQAKGFVPPEGDESSA
jgi:hypothetical protein